MKGLRRFGFGPAIRGLAKELDVDLVHAHYLLPYGWWGAWADVHPLVMSPWNTDIYTYGRERRRGRKLVRKAIAAGDEFVVSSLANAEETIRLGAPREKVNRIVWYVDLRPFGPEHRDPGLRARLGWPEDSLVVLSLRNYRPNTNLDVLVRAFARAQRRSRTRGSILAARGGWVKEEIDALLDQLELRDRVAQVFARPDELPAYCASADIGVSIASTDATPASMVESMASRLPMVMGDAVTIDEWITPGEGGEVVDCRDEDAVTEALLKLLRDPDLRTRTASGTSASSASGSATPASSWRPSIGAFSTIERSEAELPPPRRRLPARGHRRAPERGVAGDEQAISEAASFSAAYTTCPTTSPAFTSMLTGRYPAAHGIRALRGAALPDGVPSVAEELESAGYRTWCSVTGPLLDSIGLFRGFQVADYRDVPRRSVHSPWGEDAVATVRELAAAEDPFLALVHVWDVHTPRSYPRSFDRRRYGKNAYERSLAGIDAWVGRMREAAGEAVVILTGDHGENLVLEPFGLRWQGLARRITRRLPIQSWSLKMLERGVRSDSKRLLRLAPRYFWNHNQTLLESLVRVPLAFAGPGVTTGVRREPVSHVDLAPTLLELAGLPQPFPAWQGTSLAESVRTGAEPPAHAVAMEVGITPGVPTVSQHAIRDGRWKLITSLEDARVVDALFDLEEDLANGGTSRRRIQTSSRASVSGWRHSRRRASRPPRWPTRTRRSSPPASRSSATSDRRPDSAAALRARAGRRPAGAGENRVLALRRLGRGLPCRRGHASARRCRHRSLARRPAADRGAPRGRRVAPRTGRGRGRRHGLQARHSPARAHVPRSRRRRRLHAAARRARELVSRCVRNRRPRAPRSASPSRRALGPGAREVVASRRSRGRCQGPRRLRRLSRLSPQA